MGQNPASSPLHPSPAPQHNKLTAAVVVAAPELSARVLPVPFSRFDTWGKVSTAATDERRRGGSGKAEQEREDERGSRVCAD